MKQILSEVKVLPVLEIERNVDPEKLIGSLIDGNITVIEITLRNEMGFKHVESSALVRSSYRAQKHIN